MRIWNLCLILALALVMPCIALGQAPPWLGAMQLRYPLYPLDPSDATLDTGVSYICGGFQDDFTILDTVLKADTPFSVNAYVAQYGRDGKPLWVRKIGGALEYYGHNSFIWADHVLMDDAHNAYVVGTYQDTAEFGDTVLVSDSGSIFAAKYDSAGNRLWLKTLVGADAFGNPEAVIVHDHMFIEDPVGTWSAVKPLLLEFDTAGNVVWEKILDLPGNPIGVSLPVLSVDDSLNLYFSYGLNSISPLFSVAKVKPGGILAWTFTGDSTSLSTTQSITTDLNGNVYACGEFVGVGGYPSGEFRIGDTLLRTDHHGLILVKLNPNGKFLWARQGEDSIIGPLLLATDKHGNVFLAGHTIALSAWPSPNFYSTFDQDTVWGGSQIGFLVKYDSNGSLQWTYSSDTKGTWVPQNLFVSPTDTLFLQGSYDDQVMFGPTTLGYVTRNGDSSSVGWFIARMPLHETSGVQSQSIANNISMFPNPTQGVVTILGVSGPVEVENILGQTVLYASPNHSLIPALERQGDSSSGLTLDLSNEPAGTYFARIVTADGVIIRKIVKN